MPFPEQFDLRINLDFADSNFLQVGNWLEIHSLNRAGLIQPFEEEKTAFYCRQDTIEIRDTIFEFYTSDQDTRFNLYGFPGLGKSITAFFICCCLVKEHNAKVLLIHVARGNNFFSYVADNKFQPGGSFNTLEVDKLVLGYKETTLVVVDGSLARQHDFETLVQRAQSASSGAKLLVVSSEGSRPAPESNHVTVQGTVWNLEEYKDACKDDAFFQKIKPNLFVDITLEQLENARRKLKDVVDFGVPEEVFKIVIELLSTIEDYELLSREFPSDFQFIVNYIDDEVSLPESCPIEVYENAWRQSNWSSSKWEKLLGVEDKQKYEEMFRAKETNLYGQALQALGVGEAEIQDLNFSNHFSTFDTIKK